MSKFQYQARKPEEWEKRGNQQFSKFAGYAKDEFETFGPKKGDNWIRILPPTWANPGHYGYDIWVHYGVGPENGTVLCLAKMKNQACPLCEAHIRADAAGREDADDLKPTRRVLVWLVNRKDEEKMKAPLLWAMPWTLDRDISALCRDRLTGELFQIDHPDAGYDVTFDRQGDPPIVKYVGLQIARRQSPVQEKWLNYILDHPAPDTLQWRSYEEVVKLFEGQAQDSTVAAQQAAQAAPPAPPAPPVPVGTPPAPAPTTELCSKTVKMKGELFGCVLLAEHEGDCDFDRPAGGNGKIAGAPPDGLFGNKAAEPVAAEPATPAASGNSRAANLRSRFVTGGGK